MPKMKFTENIYVNDKILHMQFYLLIDVIQGLQVGKGQTQFIHYSRKER